jgi:putative colanic acid biosynthesis acetyltransferase WcaF
MTRETFTPTDLIDATKGGLPEGQATYRLGHRTFRVIWSLAWLLFARWTPAPFHGWRRIVLNLFGANISKNTYIYSSTSVWYPPYLTMGPHSCLGRNANCYNQAPVTIEAYATVSQNAELVTASHNIDHISFQLFAKPIHIKANAWVAANAFIGPGVTIGEGAVLGACAVCFKDIPDWSVYAGNPAKFIRMREKYL